MKIKQKIKQIVGGLATLVTLSTSLKALDVEAGVQHNQGTTSPYATIGQSFKEGKTIFIGKVEKVSGSPLALQVVGVYPLSNGYSVNAFEKVAVDPSLEPLCYITGAGVGKSIGRGSVSIGACGVKPAGSSKTSYSGTVSENYKIGKKVKFNGLVIIPVKKPHKPTIRASISYSL